MWGIYARSYHPPGYGYAPREGESGGRAHGYVLLAVDGGDLALPPQLTGVPFGRIAVKDSSLYGWDQWYGGDFDLVLLVDHPPSLAGWHNEGVRHQSIGDNRAVLITSLEELSRHGVKVA